MATYGSRYERPYKTNYGVAVAWLWWVESIESDCYCCRCCCKNERSLDEFSHDVRVSFSGQVKTRSTSNNSTHMYLVKHDRRQVIHNEGTTEQRYQQQQQQQQYVKSSESKQSKKQMQIWLVLPVFLHAFSMFKLQRTCTTTTTTTIMIHIGRQLLLLLLANDRRQVNIIMLSIWREVYVCCLVVVVVFCRKLITNLSIGYILADDACKEEATDVAWWWFGCDSVSSWSTMTNLGLVCLLEAAHWGYHKVQPQPTGPLGGQVNVNQCLCCINARAAGAKLCVIGQFVFSLLLDPHYKSTST